MSDDNKTSPPGWYPDTKPGAPAGQRRYWDGSAWTDRIERTTEPTATEPTTVPTAEPTTVQQSAEPARKASAFTRWGIPALVGLVAFLAGIGIGGASGYDQTTATPDEPAPTGTVTVDPGQAREAELAAQEEEVTARAAELDQREADLTEREAAVTQTETEIAEGTIPGDGIFIVGDEIAPGEYRTQAADCYWARLSGTSGELDDIIANGNGAGIVTIAESDHAFESRLCDEWTLVP